MRRFVTILMLCTGCLLTASSQTFTQRLQEKGRAGEGTVTVTHAKAIDDLVNKQSETPQATAQPQPKTETAVAPKKAEVKTQETLRDTISIAEPGRRSYKVDGFRVQAFAGGNQRKDRQKAEQIGNTIKAHYPQASVYVHFYSPRWVCRVGNYRTYEEADEMLRNIRDLGITGASIIKGKITVQN